MKWKVGNENKITLKSRMKLKINEIYYSLQGESSFMGLPCIFIRTTGCSLRCRWCDTEHAFYQGEFYCLEAILKEIKKYHCTLVLLTGGEPLDQKASYLLLSLLCDEGYTVLVETGGHRSIAEIDPRVHCIVDMKCPSSGMMKANRLENLKRVSKKDEVKFVIGNQDDYLWAMEIVDKYQLSEVSNPLFSPVYNTLPTIDLAQWILSDNSKVRLQIQQHKVIWGKDAMGV